MRLQRNKNQLLILCLVVGFLIGIVYENIVVKTEVVVLDIFLKSNLQMYLETNIVTKKYAVYVLKERLALCAWGGVFSCIKWKNFMAVILLCVIGFYSGTMVVLAVLQLGIKGLFFCVSGIMPHMIFYGIGGYIVLSYWYYYPKCQWNSAKSVFVLVLLVLGILTEIYVNPTIVKWVIGIMY